MLSWSGLSAFRKTPKEDTSSTQDGCWQRRGRKPSKVHSLYLRVPKGFDFRTRSPQFVRKSNKRAVMAKKSKTPTITRTGFDSIATAFKEALRKWWQDEAQSFDAAVAGTASVGEGMPEIDSK